MRTLHELFVVATWLATNAVHLAFAVGSSGMVEATPDQIAQLLGMAE